MRELELLAPARNIEIGIAAIDCGADAVYLAGPAFGARQAAGNSVEDIRRLCGYARRFGARVFVTLNTIIFDDELEEAFALAVQLQEAGADALIVQDFALAAFESEHPEKLSIPLHASTQCSIRTVEDARRLDALGFSRIVLERELPMSTVREICSAVDCEVEAFVHGALCVCYSGQCYLSEMLSGRSANRGECVQACRSRYDLLNAGGELVRWPSGKTEGRSRHVSGGRPGSPVAEDRTLLSLRDLNLLDRLAEMADGGVTSFKIEGRLKNISYVRNIVAAYSRALDRLVAGHPDKYRRASFGHAGCGFTPAPAKSFNRGFTQLFFDGRRDGDWACLDAGKALGEEVGTVASVQYRNGGMRIGVKPCAVIDRPQFHNGDGFSFIGSDGRETGFRADVCEGNTILCRKVEGLAPGTRLYRNLDSAFEKELEKVAVRRIPVRLTVEINEAGDGRATAQRKGDDVRHFQFHVRAVSEDGRELLHAEEIAAEPARNRERMLGMMAGQLGKEAGVYSFSVDSILCGVAPKDILTAQESIPTAQENILTAQESIPTAQKSIPMMSAAQLNAIRRAIAERLDSLPCNARPMKRRTIRDSLPELLKFPKHISYKNDVANSAAASFYRRLGAETVEPAYEVRNRGLQIGTQVGAFAAGDPAGAPDGLTCGTNCDPDGLTCGTNCAPVELMRSKYCILHELGLCRKTPAYAALAAENDIREGLFLRNNGRLLRLHFDCTNCEMTVLSK